MPGVGSMGSKSQSSSTGSSSFQLGNTDSRFANRSQDIFGTLQTLEVKHDAVHAVQSQTSPEEREGLLKPDPSEESTRTHFKPPRGRARRRPYQPGYRQEPQKWTAYNLADVTSDQLSDRANTSAAFDFLRERRTMRENAETNSSTAKVPLPDSGKLQFSQPRKRQSDLDQSNESQVKKKFRDGKRLMPEYVVGQSKASHVKPKHKPSSTATSSSSSETIGLIHLQDTDESKEMEDGKEVHIPHAESSGASLLETNAPSDNPEGVSADAAGQLNSKAVLNADVEKVVFKKVAGRRGIRKKRIEEDDDDE